jgi:PHP family Zn ribbon phosphoesterase
MNRVEQLADRPEGFQPVNAIPFKNFIPLDEVIAEAKGLNKGSVAVERDYQAAVAKFGTEFEILAKASEESLRKGLPGRICEGILRMRQGQVEIQAGFDGEYGKICLFDEGEKPQKDEKQLSLF